MVFSVCWIFGKFLVFSLGWKKVLVLMLVNDEVVGVVIIIIERCID